MNEGYEHYIGRRVRNYTILQKLGSGGSAHVYLARSCLNELPVAIKLLAPEYGNSENQQLFLQEVRFLQELQPQRYILPVLEHGKIEGIPYFVTEYASRGTLRTYINTCHSVSIEKALVVLIQIGEAIHKAHQHHIVHCDIKPENVLFNDKGDAILADFGIAVRLEASETFSGLARGTYAYMAPEQFDGMFSKEGDQYSLGCIAYELLTGKHPFEHFLPFDPLDRELMKQRHQSARLLPLKELNPTVPSQVEQAILQSMAKNASERHPSIASFAHLLQLSAPSPSFLLNHLVSPLDTPPSGPSDTDEILSPATDPSRNPNSLSAKIAVMRAINQSEHISYQKIDKVHSSNLPVRSLAKNVDKNRELHTEPSSSSAKPFVEVKESIQFNDSELAEALSPDEALRNLCLSQKPDLKSQLTTILVEFQLELIECDKEKTYELKKRPSSIVGRPCTGIKVKGSSEPVAGHYLLYISNKFLKDIKKNKDAIDALGANIPDKAYLIIFSDWDESPDLEIISIIDEWKKESVEVNYVPRKYITSLLNIKSREVKKKLIEDRIYLREALKYVELSKQAETSKSVQDMDGNDRKAIVTIVSTKLTQYTNDSVKGWDALLKEAGLDVIAGELDLKGSPKGIAGQLVDYLQTRAPLPEKPQYEVLGLLLLQLLKEVTPAQGDYETIEKIIRKYGLVPESEPLPKRKI